MIGWAVLLAVLVCLKERETNTFLFFKLFEAVWSHKTNCWKIKLNLTKFNNSSLTLLKTIFQWGDKSSFLPTVNVPDSIKCLVRCAEQVRYQHIIGVGVLAANIEFKGNFLLTYDRCELTWSVRWGERVVWRIIVLNIRNHFIISGLWPRAPLTHPIHLSAWLNSVWCQKLLWKSSLHFSTMHNIQSQRVTLFGAMKNVFVYSHIPSIIYFSKFLIIAAKIYCKWGWKLNLRAGMVVISLCSLTDSGLCYPIPPSQDVNV